MFRPTRPSMHSVFSTFFNRLIFNRVAYCYLSSENNGPIVPCVISRKMLSRHTLSSDMSAGFGGTRFSCPPQICPRVSPGRGSHVLLRYFRGFRRDEVLLFSSQIFPRVSAGRGSVVFSSDMSAGFGGTRFYSSKV